MKITAILMLILLTSISTQLKAFTHACTLVADKAGNSYQPQPNRFASIVPPNKIPINMQASLIERNGVWFIYQTDNTIFASNQCAPQIINNIEIVPVIFNQNSGSNAVINGVFMIKTHHEDDIHLIANKYNFKKVTQLPNRFTAIFNVKPQTSYDELIIKLLADKNIAKLVPLLTEPRFNQR